MNWKQGVLLLFALVVLSGMRNHANRPDCPGAAGPGKAL